MKFVGTILIGAAALVACSSPQEPPASASSSNVVAASRESREELGVVTWSLGDGNVEGRDASDRVVTKLQHHLEELEEGHRIFKVAFRYYDESGAMKIEMRDSDGEPSMETLENSFSTSPEYARALELLNQDLNPNNGGTASPQNTRPLAVKSALSPLDVVSDEGKELITSKHCVELVVSTCAASKEESQAAAEAAQCLNSNESNCPRIDGKFGEGSVGEGCLRNKCSSSLTKISAASAKVWSDCCPQSNQGSGR